MDPIETVENEISPDVCRLCLKKSTILKSMFHCLVGSYTYAEIYQICTGFPVNESSHLPKRICNDCEDLLMSFYTFRLQIESIEERLQSYLTQYEHKITSPEPNDALSSEDDLDLSENNFIVENYETEEETFEEDAIFEGDHLYIEQELLETIEENAPQEKDLESRINCLFTMSEENSKEVKCTTCSDGCEAEKTINKIAPETDYPITCVCKSVLKNRRSFIGHSSATLVHKKENTKLKCRKCDKKFYTWRSRSAHEASTHNLNNKHQCSSCNKRFYRSDHCKEHEKKCCKVEDPLQKFFSCAVCLFTFQREETYQKHLETAHPGASNNDKDCLNRAEDFSQRYPNRITMSSNEEALKNRPSCTICNKLFKNDVNLQKHKSLFHSDQVWACEKCDEVFVHRSTKISHMSKAHGLKKPFECSYENCSFSCFKKDRFNAHIAKHENPDKKFPCPICQQEFKSYNTMTLHRARHLTNNTYACGTCNKHFLDKRNYNVHLKLHTGEDLHHCSVCNRGFNRKDHLKKHQIRKNHHEITTEEGNYS